MLYRILEYLKASKLYYCSLFNVYQWHCSVTSTWYHRIFRCSSMSKLPNILFIEKYFSFVKFFPFFNVAFISNIHSFSTGYLVSPSMYKFHVNVLTFNSTSIEHLQINAFVFMYVYDIDKVKKWSKQNRNDEEKETKSKRINWKKIEMGKMVCVFRFSFNVCS